MTDDLKIKRQVWENTLAGRYYIKGQRDRATQRAVLASRNGDQFGPEHCYWAFIKDLPDGAYYIDSEKPN